MWDYLVSGGYAMWGVLLCGIVMAITAVRAAIRPVSRTDLDGILLWAGAALGVGVIGTLVGISYVARAMSLVQTALAHVPPRVDPDAAAGTPSS